MRLRRMHTAIGDSLLDLKETCQGCCLVLSPFIKKVHVHLSKKYRKKSICLVYYIRTIFFEATKLALAWSISVHVGTTVVPTGGQGRLILAVM